MDYSLGKDMTESKLIILYILYNSKMDLKNTEISRIITENNLINYFIMQQCIKELIDSNQIIVSKIENIGLCYGLSESGKEAVNYFYKRIPYSVRQKIINILDEKKDEFKQEREVIADFYPEGENNFTVACKIVENKTTLIELKLSVGTKKQAKQICDIWKENPGDIYSNIISILNKKQKK